MDSSSTGSTTGPVFLPGHIYNAIVKDTPVKEYTAKDSDTNKRIRHK
jgi:hypothetical protein